ncbi:hypothetical protein ARAM_003619 [Aspergillus rambellii]|uniref:Chitin synthase activator (Chs3) n=1 Tax=Aspergillus rambellii TaxID=308745 RepID=A0A0F8XUL5_9EURO|nr:hypothetical protein ARAM_003619 [Aspergillus rambellii]
MAYPQQRAPPVRNYGGAPPRGGGAPPRGMAYDYGYGNQYEPGDGGYSNGGYGNPPEQAAPRSYGPPRGAPLSSRGGYGPRGGRGYAPNGRPPPRGYDSQRGGYGERRPPLSQDHMRQPPRNDTMSPDKMSFDNPFPTFPSKEQQGMKGIERNMAAMNINGPMPPRPHTSNSRRPPDMPRQPRPGSPGRGRPDLSGSPMRSASAGRMRPPVDLQGPPPMPYVNRSATMPVPGGGAYPGQGTYRDPRESAFVTTLLDSYYNTAPDDPDMPNFDAIPEHGNGGTIDEDLPGLEQPKPKPKPVESAPPQGQYKAFNPQAAPVQSMPEPTSPTGANQFATAGFQFDLPGEPPSAGYPQNGMGNGYEPYEDPMNTPYSPQQVSRGNAMPAYMAGGYMSPPGESSVHNGPLQPYMANQPLPSNDQLIDEHQGMDPQSPDALPYHPAPFRPGHDQGPAPVRQYSSPPNSQAPLASAPQSPPPNDPTPPPAPVTHAELERLQQQARGNPSDQKTQLLLAEKLVEASGVLIESSRMDPKSKSKAREKYVMDAYKIVKKLVSNGYPDAQFYLADCYGQGLLGLQVDAKEAFQLYQSAAKAGHAQAAYRVAVCCEIGQEEGGGTKRDPFKAVQWYKRAASLGDPPAMYKMGMIQLKGLLGQARSPREGISWLKRAAERADEENPHALHELALMYANAGDNDVVIRDEAYASQLFHQAAELGYKFSQFRLGMAYEYGLMGCPVDSRQSIMLYSAAAAQGEHQSELALSGWYLTGCEGILQQSDTEAYLWARKAAASGLAKAEYAMGYFTEVGIGATANLDDAKRWYWRAAAQGFPKARERLEELKKGGARMQKTRLSRSAVNQQKPNEGDCVVM